MKRRRIFLVSFCATVLVGCAHKIEYTNLHQYEEIDGECDLRQQGLMVRIKYSDLSHDEQMFGYEMAKCLRKKANYVVDECNGRNSSEHDVDLRLSVECSRGAPCFTNWLIFEGWFVFAPRWHGFEYYVSYRVRCDLTASVNGNKIGSVVEQFDLDMRYCDSEVPALTMGPNAPCPFYAFNDAINPCLDKDVIPILACNVASKVVRMINDKNWENIDSSTTY